MPAAVAAGAAGIGAALALHRPYRRTLRRRWLSLHKRAPALVLLMARGGEATDKPAEPVSQEQDDHRDCLQKAFSFLSGVLGSLFSILGSWTSVGQKGPEEDSKPTARIVQQMGRSPIDVGKGVPVYSLGPFPRCTEASDLRRKDRHFTVVTTAALPWMTGPAINPLLRALYLARRGHAVVLVLPWLSREDQARLFEREVFDSPAEQERYIRQWCLERAKISSSSLQLEFRWYEASYIEAVRSIFPSGDCSQGLGDVPMDVLILEEPEHLCWYHNGQRWTELFRHVIGVVHTNYQVYLEGLGYKGLMGSAAFRDSLFFTFTSMVCSAYCDVTIKLSAAGISLPNEVDCNIHGVRQEFLDIGRQADELARRTSSSDNPAQVYFIGKAILQKGWVQLFDLLAALRSHEETKVEADEAPSLIVDAYGSGPDSEAIAQRAESAQQDGGSLVRLFPGRDHGDERFWHYKVLVNPSTTEMLCTVTAEALGMGKRVVIPEHPSNDFFKVNFPDRCHLFTPEDPISFQTALLAALAAPGPQPLPKAAEEQLSWETAVDRLCDAAEVRVLSGTFSRPSQVAGARLAYEMHKGIQTDAPGLTDLLKNATLKSRTPWEDYMVQWGKSESSQRILDQIESSVKLFQKDVV